MKRSVAVIALSVGIILGFLLSLYQHVTYQATYPCRPSTCIPENENWKSILEYDGTCHQVELPPVVGKPRKDVTK